LYYYDTYSTDFNDNNYIHNCNIVYDITVGYVILSNDTFFHWKLKKYITFFGQSGTFWPKWHFLAKVALFGQVALFSQCGTFWPKWHTFFAK